MSRQRPLHKEIPDYEWKALAVNAANVGRWVWNTKTGFVEHDTTLRKMLGFEDKPRVFSISDVFDRIHLEDRFQASQVAQKAATKISRFDVDYRFIRPDTGQEIWLKAIGSAFKNEHGEVWLIGVNYDITRAKLAEARSIMLAGEMAHRMRNLLTIVTSIYRMASSKAESVESLTEAFLPRLDALNALNDLIMRSNDGAVSLTDIVHSVFEGIAGSRDIDLDIAPLNVNSTAAQTITMTLGELTTNAVKHGALSDPGGRVFLSFRHDRDNDKLFLEWREKCPFKVVKPEKSSGFGMKVLVKLIRYTYGGIPTISWEPDGLVYQCEWQASKLSSNYYS